MCQNLDSLIDAIEKISCKTWLDYFIAFGPFLLSLVAICISIRTSREQNKIDLLDKRLTIYTDLKMCISNTIIEGKVTAKDANLFLIKMRDVEFLFDQKLDELCGEIYKSMLELHCVGEKVEAGINGSKNVGDYAENCKREGELLEKMYDYSELLKDAFSSYISFKKIKKCQKKK